MSTNPPQNPARSVRRIRHEVRRRRLRVVRTQKLSPTMLRITFGGPELAGFTSAAADDHVKLFLPVPGAPAADASEPAGVSRDYTPRRFDAQKLELDIEFALHGEGPAMRWAQAAAPGQELVIGGPRGSFVVQGDFDWYLLVGDETALPAIARRLEELPAGARATVIAEVDDASNQLPLASVATVTTRWVHRDGAAPGDATLLSAALSEWEPAQGTGYTWIAAESHVARMLRTQLLARGFDRQWLKAAGYWKRGASASHEPIDD